MIPLSPLRGYKKSIGAISIEEVTDLSLVSVATPKGYEAKLAAALKKLHGWDIPAPGQSVIDSDARLINMAPGQFFIAFKTDAPLPSVLVGKALGDAAYVVDQTDAWVILRLNGTGVRAALERICPIDLHPDRFEINAATRTMMEHLNTTIIREADDSFLIMSASSSAKSFVHAIEVSAQNVD